LEKARQASKHKHDHLAAQRSALGPPRQRADRDFRPQTIMTVRTRLLANALMSFMAALRGHLSRQGSLECRLQILLERRGARMETASQVLYWRNPTGLSVPYQRLLTAVVDGLCTMDLR
jgi:hypothetical protein